LSRHEEIRQLDQQLTELDEQQRKSVEEAELLTQKRDKLNLKFRDLRADIIKLRDERDELNSKVKEFKLRRTELKSKIAQKIDEAKKLHPKLAALNTKRPDEPMLSLKEQIEEIDWKIQTSSLQQEEEKQLVNRVRELETQLNIYRKLDKLKQENLAIQAHIDSLKTGEKNLHEKLAANAEKSQELHKKMIEKIEESKKVKMEADNMHKAFLETMKNAKGIADQMTVVSIQKRELTGSAREEARKEKAATVTALRKKLEGEAREKLRRGEKLTLEEFQLLANKEEAQD
jgi:uncharacterized coiled-coil DUF342 family protein